MALTAKERSKRWRDKQKANSSRHESYLHDERERYKRRKSTGKRQGIHDMPTSMQAKIRQKWKEERKANRKKRIIILPPSPTSSIAGPSPQSDNVEHRGRKKIKRDRAKAYRVIHHLKIKLSLKSKTVEKYRKRLDRIKVTADSPRSRINRTVKKSLVNDKVRRSLIFYTSLSQDLRNKYKTLKSRRSKMDFYNFLSLKIVKKYRMLGIASKFLGCSRRCLKSSKPHSSMDEKPESSKRVPDCIVEKVKEFFQRDDNSRATAGKKETITRFKSKMQKRLLCDSIYNLHDKFLAENSDVSMSYNTFRKLRPFWVVIPKAANRQTCLCKTCENLNLKAEKLYIEGVISTKNIRQIAETLCCNCDSHELRKACMYRECANCQIRKLHQPKEIDYSKDVEWYVWRNKRKEYDRKSSDSRETVTVQFIEKDTEHSQLIHLVNDFEVELKSKGMPHMFNIICQFKAIRNMKESLTENEVILHIDFSENYACKLSSEVHAMHFGASKRQATLHTGVAYLKSKTLPFCSISSSTRHDPAAIWAHLIPVIKWIESNVANLKQIKFISDCPVTQYRSKKNFFLFSCYLPTLTSKALESSSWIYTEAGHGKGAADGIGGLLKRTADQQVANGHDISTAKMLYDILVDKVSTKLFYVEPEEIAVVDKVLPSQITALTGTMKVHQIYWKTPGNLQAKHVSCNCKTYSDDCTCFPSTECVYSDGILSSKSDENSTAHVKSAVPSPPFEILDEPSQEDVGKCCIVLYDQKVYPGEIVDIDPVDYSIESIFLAGNG